MSSGNAEPAPMPPHDRACASSFGARIASKFLPLGSNAGSADANPGSPTRQTYPQAEPELVESASCNCEGSLDLRAGTEVGPARLRHN
jgi:hypothetical protein